MILVNEWLYLEKVIKKLKFHHIKCDYDVNVHYVMMKWLESN